MSNGTFDFNLFVKESKDVLMNPKSYFSTMKTTGGIPEPLIKAIIYGAVSGLISFLYSVIGVGALSGGMFGGAIGVMVFIWAIIGSIIGLFILAVIVLVLSAICKGNTDFESCIRVAASLMVIMPISSLLGIAGSLNLYLGVVVGLVINIYALWLLYNGLVEALKSKPETTKIVTYVLIAIFVIFSFIGIGMKKTADKFMDSDMKELFKEMENN